MLTELTLSKVRKESGLIFYVSIFLTRCLLKPICQLVTPCYWIAGALSYPVSEYRALRSRAARNIWYLCLNLCLRCSYRFISICSSNKTFRGPYKFTWRVFTLKATEISLNINNVLQISFDNFTKFQPIFFYKLTITTMQCTLSKTTMIFF